MSREYGELLGVIALSGLRRAAVGVPPELIIDLYEVFKKALIDAYMEAERNPDCLSVEESVNGSKLYDLDKGVTVAGKTIMFNCRDLIVRCNLDIQVELNLDVVSRFTVEGGIPYTNSAMRRIRQVRVTTTAPTEVKLQFLGFQLESV